MVAQRSRMTLGGRATSIWQLLRPRAQRTHVGILRDGVQHMGYSSHPGGNTSGSDVQRPKVTLQTVRNLYRKNIPITVLTAHDYPSGIVADRGGIDIVLVGDSLAMVALGYENTNQITLDEMISHTRAVARGAKAPFLVADLSFGTYEISAEQALATSIRMAQEGRAEAVKLEGGIEMAHTISTITRAGIPVMGHIGLTPQRSTSLGGFRVQGKTATAAQHLLESAQALEAAGCFTIVLEAVPEEVGKYITERVSVPTIGIGAGKYCSGQVLVQMDMLGYFDKFTPKFVKKYADMHGTTIAAVADYASEVRAGTFPAAEHTYPMSEQETARLAERADKME
ncbi:ketopantoate hydroxymethyltransferase-domain-containing protein [Limtongia smithiae]|uniref:ketopantoate hydroxymethyltransferase-domain-containing protein n=1 Tax=Limtongia smithiae TaxID=1125753 RepID=UPI0034CFD9B4